jgi:RNA polymerase sigma factor (TIGR02999 family)
MHEITELLKKWCDGDPQALNKLIPLVDYELRKTAHHYMRQERDGHILQTTALINEALMKLIRENCSWQNRKQFYVFIARRMRQVLIDYAKKRPRAKHVGLDEARRVEGKFHELLRLEEALKALATIDQRQATVVECRYFIGLSIPEVARVLDVAPATVERDWRAARAWLWRQLTRNDPSSL